MARYLAKRPMVNCKCGARFATKKFVRVPSSDKHFWDRHCPNCGRFWGAAPRPPRPRDR